MNGSGNWWHLVWLLIEALFIAVVAVLLCLGIRRAPFGSAAPKSSAWLKWGAQGIVVFLALLLFAHLAGWIP